MHELAIAESIVAAVMAEMEKQQLKRVDRIVVRVGELTDVVPESLEFGYQAITADTALASTDLVIERVAVKAKCEGCDQTFEVSGFVFVCPNCRSNSITMIQGNELDIAYLEIDDEVPSADKPQEKQP